MQMIYQLDSRVRYSEVDAQSRLTWPALLDYFQDCSVFQSEQLKVGVEYLAKNHLAWVLSSWQICKNDFPRLGEQIAVQTWAYDMKGFYGYRNFSMNDGQGKRLAYANSVWVLMDTHAGRPIRVPENMMEIYGREQGIVMECSERKIRIPKEMAAREAIAVQSYFIDTNHHMNNGKYVLIAQEFLPEDFQIGEIRVEYKKAAKLGDILYPKVAVEEERVTVLLADENGKPYAVIAFLAE